MTLKKDLRKQWIKEKKLCKKRETPLVFGDQKKVAKRIIKSFSKNDLVTLCAPPQWGKTGVSLYVSYIMSQKKGIDPGNVFFITAMSDRSWVQQTKSRVLPMWRKNVYHRNTLNNLEARIKILREEKKDTNILIIVDECHIANKRKHILGKIFEEMGLKDQENLSTKNIKILQISATPSNALIDAEKWLNHEKIWTKVNPGYVSFQTLLDEDRIRDLHDLRTEEGSENYFSEVCLGKPMYHFIRSVACGITGPSIYISTKASIKKQCEKKGAEFVELNMTKTLKQIDEIYENLNKQPEKHTFVLIKNMLGASKTLPDKYMGSVHESTPCDKSYSSEIQGLPGRMCGWSKRRGPEGTKIYCQRKIVENYILLCESEFDFHTEDLIWNDSRLKINKNGTVNSKGSYITPLGEEDANNDEVSEISPLTEEKRTSEI